MKVVRLQPYTHLATSLSQPLAIAARTSCQSHTSLSPFTLPPQPQTNERTLIKQLGTWLGLLTFSKNRPVLARDMDFKAMICDAYQRGRMIAVLPFVEKVLAACKGSKVFKATNPMIAGILALLAEIHAMERLKLNISFVIEMTFKTFEVGALGPAWMAWHVLKGQRLILLARGGCTIPSVYLVCIDGMACIHGPGMVLLARGGCTVPAEDSRCDRPAVSSMMACVSLRVY